jgi:S1-C subfamily serine protease
MSIDGTIVKSMDELNAIKNTHKIGDKVVLKIERDGKEMDITITLSQMP